MGFGWGGGGGGCRGSVRNAGFNERAGIGVARGLGLLDRPTEDALPAAFRGFTTLCGRGSVRLFEETAFFFEAALAFEADTEPDFFAFRAGAFPEDERLVIGLRRTALPAKLRFLAVVDVED